MSHLKKMVTIKRAVAGVVFALACNIAVADTASDFKDPTITINSTLAAAPPPPPPPPGGSGGGGAASPS